MVCSWLLRSYINRLALLVGLSVSGIAQADYITVTAHTNSGAQWPTCNLTLTTAQLNMHTKQDFENKLDEYCKSQEKDTEQVDETCVGKDPPPAVLFVFAQGSANVATDKSLHCTCTKTPKQNRDALSLELEAFCSSSVDTEMVCIEALNQILTE